MKKTGDEVAQLLPAPNGWRTVTATGTHDAPALAEAIMHAPATGAVHLALPCHAVLMERMSLPSSDREELRGMVELQLEKTLPYPIEEVVWDFQVLHSEEEEAGSSLLALAVHRPVLEDLCSPLRAANRLPATIQLYAQQLAALAPAEEVVLMLWQEGEQLAAAVVERGKLGWAQTIPALEPAMLEGELPVLLLSAEMQGADVQFTQVLLAPECAALGSTVTTLLPVPLGAWPSSASVPAAPVSLLPREWVTESGRVERLERLKQRAMVAAVVYLVLIAAAFVYLAFRKHTVRKLDAQIARTRPLIEATQERQAKWEALAAAVQPNRYAVHILWLVYKNRPLDDVRITVFDYAPTQFMVEGEAPSAALAIDFAERLRKETALGDYTIEAGPPQILPNEHAQFRIFGKLP